MGWQVIGTKSVYQPYYVRRRGRSLRVASFYNIGSKHMGVTVIIQYSYNYGGEDGIVGEDYGGPVVYNPPIGNVYRGRFVGTFEGQSLSGTTGALTYDGTEKEVKINLPDHSKPTEGTLSGTLYLEQYVTDTPSYINVPSQEVSKGSTIQISWGNSPDASSYRLERQINGGSWSQIYSGTQTSYTDTVQNDWVTIRYRVRAYNSTYGYSSYVTSNTITVKQFPELKIKINGEQKTSEAGWVKINGELKEIEKIFIKVNGELKEV